MDKAYTQIYCHILIIVQGRFQLISNGWKDELYKYIAGIISNQGQKLIIINGMPDHVHLLIGMKANCNLSDLMRDIKGSSTKWINRKGFIGGKFKWQSGFGAFTNGHSEISIIANYIKSQERLHKNISLKEEYIGMLKEYDVDYKEEYLFN